MNTRKTLYLCLVLFAWCAMANSKLKSRRMESLVHKAKLAQMGVSSETLSSDESTILWFTNVLDYNMAAVALLPLVSDPDNEFEDTVDGFGYLWCNLNVRLLQAIPGTVIAFNGEPNPDTPSDINLKQFDGQHFNVASVFQALFEIEITDIDNRKGRDITDRGENATVILPALGPVPVLNHYTAIFSKTEKNFGLFPPSDSPFVLPVPIIIETPGDVNQNGIMDFVSIDMAVFATKPPVVGSDALVPPFAPQTSGNCSFGLEGHIQGFVFDSLSTPPPANFTVGLPSSASFSSFIESQSEEEEEEEPEQTEFVGNTTVSMILQNAEVREDPHFYGFDGSTFDFQGQAGQVFALISDAGFQMNAKFVKGIQPGKKTFMGEIGIVVEGVPIVIKPFHPVLVHGKPITSGALQLPAPNGKGHVGVVSFDDESHAVRISTASFQVLVKTVSHEHQKTHLNIQCSAHSAHLVNPHGILGQTAQYMIQGKFPIPTHVPRANLNARGFIEGSAVDYVVTDGILGHRFRFNRYDDIHFEGGRPSKGSQWAVARSLGQ